MLSRVAGVVNSEYFIRDAEKMQKPASAVHSFKKDLDEKIQQITRVEASGGIKEETEKNDIPYYGTDIRKDRKPSDDKTQVSKETRQYYAGYDRIDLQPEDGDQLQQGINMIKAKAAYFMA